MPAVRSPERPSPLTKAPLLFTHQQQPGSPQPGWLGPQNDSQRRASSGARWEQGREGQAQRALQEAESRAKELWERVAPISASESSQKLSRVLTQPLLQIKITAGQRGGLALFGVGQTCPPSQGVPFGAEPRGHWGRTSACSFASLGIKPAMQNLYVPQVLSRVSHTTIYEHVPAAEGQAEREAKTHRSWIKTGDGVRAEADVTERPLWHHDNIQFASFYT